MIGSGGSKTGAHVIFVGAEGHGRVRGRLAGGAGIEALTQGRAEAGFEVLEGALGLGGGGQMHEVLALQIDEGGGGGELLAVIVEPAENEPARIGFTSQTHEGGVTENDAGGRAEQVAGVAAIGAVEHGDAAAAQALAESDDKAFTHPVEIGVAGTVGERQDQAAGEGGCGRARVRDLGGGCGGSEGGAQAERKWKQALQQLQL